MEIETVPIESLTDDERENIEVALSGDERANIAAARFTITHGGRDLPVTNIFDSEGVETQCVRDAFRCVAYDAARSGAKWVVLFDLKPGVLTERTS